MRRFGFDGSRRGALLACAAVAGLALPLGSVQGGIAGSDLRGVPVAV
jgi:hypothetical protein